MNPAEQPHRNQRSRLWDMLHAEHKLSLLDSELDEIILLAQECPSLDSPHPHSPASKGVPESGGESDLDKALAISGIFQKELIASKELFRVHTKSVGDFLNELYALMVDPLADGAKEVSEIRAELLAAAERDRGLRDALESIARAPAFDANTQSIVDLARSALRHAPCPSLPSDGDLGELTMDEKLLLTVAHFDLQYHRLQSFAKGLLATARAFSGHQTVVLTTRLDALQEVANESAPKWDRESLRKMIRPAATEKQEGAL